MSLDLNAPYWPLLILFINLVLGWGIWSIRQAIERKLEEGLRAYTKRLDGHEKRLATVEERLQQAPSHRDIAGINNQLAVLHGDIKTSTATMQGISESQKSLAASLAIVNQYLLEKTK